ncbi:hypothetical protein [Nocardiopsis synnemataformans]|uniref:hypothetical protein n=1 Tax=Nocardiopsis synnemataformans TaxID=61305 RepID=UPI003EBD6000
MMPPHCTEKALDRNGHRRYCVLEAGHEGDHMDRYGRTWEPPGVTLARLQRRWGHTHRVAWTGETWLATAHDPSAPWRSETERTPEQLEESLQRHNPQGVNASWS